MVAPAVRKTSIRPHARLRAPPPASAAFSVRREDSGRLWFLSNTITKCIDGPTFAHHIHRAASMGARAAIDCSLTRIVCASSSGGYLCRLHCRVVCTPRALR